MDPNVTLRELDTLICPAGPLSDEFLELAQALSGWLRNGGFEPNWDDYPRGTKLWKLWKKGSI